MLVFHPLWKQKDIKTVLIITIIMSFLNAVLNYIFIKTLPIAASNSVSFATTILRYLFCFIIAVMAYRVSAVNIRITFSKTLNTTLLKYGKSESITSFFLQALLLLCFTFYLKYQIHITLLI